MGNDGGSIPKRRELVKEAARNRNASEVKAGLIEAQTHAWTTCPLSNLPLTAPIVSDSSGMLYNKDAIIEHLLPRSDSPPKDADNEVLGGRIQGLRDIVEVKFRTEKDVSSKEEKRICPVTSKELGAHTKAVYLVPCGHAFSQAAIKEVASEACLECNEPYTAENIIPILPTSKDDISRLAARATKLKESGLTHSLKKAPGSKKRKKQHADVEPTAATNGTDVSSTEPSVEKKSLADAEKPATPDAKINGEVKPKQNDDRASKRASSSGIKNASTASLTEKVLMEQEQLNKRRKMGMNDNLKSLFKSSSNIDSAKHANSDFMTRGFTVPSKR